jgi:hypothetical protein
VSGCRLADKQVFKVIKDAEPIGISVFGTAVREMPAFGRKQSNECRSLAAP